MTDAAFFCLKNSLAVAQGLVTKWVECSAGAVRMRVWNMAGSLVSNVPSVWAGGVVELAMIAVWTIYPSLPLICWRIDGFDTRSMAVGDGVRLGVTRVGLNMDRGWRCKWCEGS